MRKNGLILFLPILFGTLFQLRLTAQQPAGLLQSAIYEEEINGDINAAINLYIQIVEHFSSNRPAAAEALLRLGIAHEKLGRRQAEDYYRRLINEYADQTDFVQRARARLLRNGFSQSEVEAPKSNQLTATSIDFNPGAYSAISPDGKYISYREFEQFQLTLYDMVSGESRTLTDENGGNCVKSIWSPDSKKIAYQWALHDSVQSFRKAVDLELRIYDVETGTDRFLCSAITPYGEIMPMHWARDGSSVLGFIGVRNGLDRLVTVSVDNGNVELIKEIQGWCGPACQLSISPDDQIFLYDTSSTDGKIGIRILAQDRSIDRPMSIDQANNWIASWLPNGMGFLYYSDLINKSYALWKATVNEDMEITSTEMILDGIGDYSTNLGMTDDGIFYYRQHVRRGDLYIVEFDPDQRTLGSPQLISSEDLRNPIFASWLPDGSQLGYQKNETGRTWIEMINILSGDVSELDIPSLGYRGNGTGWVKWSQDGTKLLLTLSTGASNAMRKLELVLIDLSTDELKTIDQDVRGQPYFCTPGNIVYADDNNHLKIYNLDSKAIDIAYTSEKNLVHLAASPDGKHLVFFEGPKDKIRDLKDLVLLDVENKIRTVLWTLSESERFSTVSGIQWLEDSQQILMGIEDIEGTSQQLYIYDLSAELMIKLGDSISGSKMIGLKIHPTKNLFSYSRLYVKANVWKVENY